MMCFMSMIWDCIFAEAERRKEEEAKRKAKLDEIAAKQRQRELELEEKEKRWKEEVLQMRPTIVPANSAHSDQPRTLDSAPSQGGKYIPKHRRTQAESAPPPQDQPPVRRGGDNRMDDRPDKWRDDRRPVSGMVGGPRSSFLSSRSRGER